VKIFSIFVAFLENMNFNFSLLTGLVIAAGILIRKEAIMIQTEIVKEIVRLQATTAYTGEFLKNKNECNILTFF
jgi:predicted transcriptional regulator